MKYKVTTDVLEDIGKGDEISDSWRDRMIQAGCPESWFQPIEQVEEGQYWVWCSETYRVGELHSNRESWFQELKTGDEISIPRKHVQKEGRKLSTYEIKEALIKEAKRRGYDSKAFKCMSGLNTGLKELGFKYDANNDLLFYGSDCCYYKGQFAEIIDQTPDIEINGYKAENKNELLKFGCLEARKEDVRILREAIHRYDLDIIREGERINKQIHEIAQYYGKQ